MPWQDNSGDNNGPVRGPWGQPSGKGSRNNGSGNRGPGRGTGRNNDAPDLEDLLEASRQRLKRAFPNGSGGGGGGKGPEISGRMMGIGAALLAFLWGISGFYTIDAGELGVETTFGAFSAVTPSGLQWHFPSPIQNVNKVDVESIRKLPVPASRNRNGGQSDGLMLTGDKNIVDVALVVNYKIKSDLVSNNSIPGVAQYLFNVDNPENVVRTVAEASIREVVGRNTLDFIQTGGRSDIQDQTRALLQSALDQYQAGIEVTEINLEKTEPPNQEVNDAFLDVEAADQDRQRTIDSARAYANKVVPEARGKAQQILEQARGYAARVTAESRGQADRFKAILNEYKKAPKVTRQRMYLETLETVLGDMNKIIVEDDAGSGVVPYLPLNEINRKAP
ncbi:MAG: FtsH protease activity modulator HflK [Pseudomonadota bacterium]